MRWINTFVEPGKQQMTRGAMPLECYMAAGMTLSMTWGVAPARVSNMTLSRTFGQGWAETWWRTNSCVTRLRTVGGGFWTGIVCLTEMSLFVQCWSVRHMTLQIVHRRWSCVNFWLYSHWGVRTSVCACLYYNYIFYIIRFLFKIFVMVNCFPNILMILKKNC